MISSEDIRNAKFNKSALFGYKVEDVDSFLEKMEIAFKEIECKLAFAEKKLADLSSKEIN